MPCRFNTDYGLVMSISYPDSQNYRHISQELPKSRSARDEKKILLYKWAECKSTTYKVRIVSIIHVGYFCTEMGTSKMLDILKRCQRKSCIPCSMARATLKTIKEDLARSRSEGTKNRQRTDGNSWKQKWNLGQNDYLFQWFAMQVKVRTITVPCKQKSSNDSGQRSYIFYFAATLYCNIFFYLTKQD